MRTTKATTKPAKPTATPSVAVAVSAKTRTLIDQIREDFDAFANGFAQLITDRVALAPKFMKAFGAWASETGGSFAAFVRVLDSSVPEERDGYRAHATYQAADYLRRLSAASAREVEETPEGERPVTAYQALAYLVATVMPVVDPTGAIWSAFVREMHWSDAQAERVKVAAARLGAVKLPPRTKSQLTHVRTAAA